MTATQEVDVVFGNIFGHLTLAPGTIAAGVSFAGKLAQPYRYQAVNVLIVRWAQYLDQDSKCGEEVSKLKEIFSKGFNFNTKVLELHNKKHPQLQLDTGINQFILDGDGPCRSHLMIVYYTGHGCGRGDGLWISGVREVGVSAIDAKYDPLALWNKAQESLLHLAKADVLLIMDTCNAGNVIKAGSEDTRSFEILTAAPKDTPTAAAGPRSFSKAMIDVLREQLEPENQFPFTAFDLNAKIISRRAKQHSQVHPLLNIHSHRHIKIAPLQYQSRGSSLPPAMPEASHLTIRLTFEKLTSLMKHETEILAKVLSKATSESELGISRIEWVEHTRGPRSIWDAYMLYKSVRNVQRRWRQHLSNTRLKWKRDVDDDDDGETLVKKRVQGLPNSDAGGSTHVSPI